MCKIHLKIKAVEAKQLKQTECFPGSTCPETQKNMRQMKTLQEQPRSSSPVSGGFPLGRTGRDGKHTGFLRPEDTFSCLLVEGAAQAIAEAGQGGHMSGLFSPCIGI